jgi:hypothetical protein
MSADNWSQCPQCIRTMKVRFENFKSEFVIILRRHGDEIPF